MSKQTSQLATPRNGFGDALLTLGRTDKRVVVLTADLMESTRAAAFAAQYPDRFINVGVAEQNMIGVAVGIANEGYIPFCTSYAAFSPGRNFDQLRVSVCYDGANVKIIGSHAGISVGEDGASHQMLEDIALTRVLPGLVVLAPADIYEAKAATLAAARYNGPVYIRLSRAEEPIVTTAKQQFTIGKARLIQTGEDVTVCTTGSMLQPTMSAIKELCSRLSCELIHFPTIKPLDAETLLKSVRKTKRVVTVEEAQRAGGFGGAIAELLSEKLPVTVRRVGIEDTFGESGSAEALREKYGLGAAAIAAAIVATRITTS